VICDGAGGSPAVARSAAAGAHAAWWALQAVQQLLRRDASAPRRRLQQRFRGAFLNRCRRAPRLDHTILACRWDRHWLLVAQVGDSSLLIRRAGHWQLALPPHKGESANETTFLRASTATSAIGLRRFPAAQVQGLIAFSDGLEAAFLSPCPNQPELLLPHDALAELVLAEHRQRCGSRSYPAWLQASLADPALAALSDDDRTLVIAIP
jgi:hypothetical protein